ncbi:SWIM zinc finger family protein [Oribacterium sp. HCP3S3_B9]|uniref:SWIM zinc finger family protein n=1 Tax=Oribacterium sp. HCP3S3_B9 TaxID=3438946 RepID=UPI003F8CA285
MSLIGVASADSVWRGMEYYEDKMVASWNEAADGTYDGVVEGSNGNSYVVHVDKIHPRKSTCTCPFAEGRRVVCKHMIALYFTAEPKVAEDFKKQVENWEREEEERAKQHYDDLKKYVNSLKKQELQMQLYDALVELEEIKNRRWY